MNFKKILLVSIFLLAIMTLGAVSASDDVNIDDNLTVSNEMDESADLSVENDDIIAVEDSQQDISEYCNDEIGSSQDDVLGDGSDKINLDYDVVVYSEELRQSKSPVCDIRLPSEATGTLNIKVNGTDSYTTTLSGNNEFKIKLGDLKYDFNYGVYNIELLYSGDNHFASYHKSFNYEVVYLSVLDLSFLPSDNPYIYVDVSHIDVTGTLDLEINGKTFSRGRNLSDKVIYRYSWSGISSYLHYGLNDVVVYYNTSNDNLTSRTFHGTITVSIKPGYDLPKDMYSNGYQNIYFDIPGGSEWNLIVFLDGDVYNNRTRSPGHAYIGVENLETGTHNVSVLLENGTIQFSTETKEFKVLPDRNIEKSYYCDDNKTLILSDNHQLNCSVTVIGWGEFGDEFTFTRNMENGELIIPMDDYLVYGNYNMYIKYDLENEVLYDSFSVSILPKVIIPSEIVVDGNGTIELAMPSDATGYFVVTIDDTKLSYCSLNDGKSSYLISNLTFDDHTIKVSYTGTDYSFKEVTKNIKIAPKFYYGVCQ